MRRADNFRANDRATNLDVVQEKALGQTKTNGAIRPPSCQTWQTVKTDVEAGEAGP